MVAGVHERSSAITVYLVFVCGIYGDPYFYFNADATGAAQSDSRLIFGHRFRLAEIFDCIVHKNKDIKK